MGYLISTLQIGVVHYSQEEGQEYKLAVSVHHLDRELVHQCCEHLQQLQPALRTVVRQVLDHVVYVLFQSLLLQWVLQNELNEDGGACCLDILLDAGNHHVFDSLHQIIQVSAQEPPLYKGPQTHEHIRLVREIVQVCLDDENQCFDLCLREIIVDRVSPHEFSDTLEQSVQELVVFGGRGLVEKFEDARDELPQHLFERGEAEMDDLDQDVKGCYNDGIVERFEGVEKEFDKGVELGLQFTLHCDGGHVSLLMLIAIKDKASMLECLTQALEAKISQDSAAYFIGLLGGDHLVDLDPLHLDAMTLLHHLLFVLADELGVCLGSIISACLLIIDLSLPGHLYTFVHDRVQED